MELMHLQPLYYLLVLVVLAVFLRYSLVNRPRGLKLLSFVMRAAGIGLIAVALCRPFAHSDSDRLHAVFLVDVSESVELEAAAGALDAVEDAVAALRGGDSYSLFLAGKDLMPMADTAAAREVLRQWRETLPDSDFRSATPIGDLLLAARLAFPADKARRMVLYSDGVSTGEETAAALETLGQEKINVRLEKLASLSEPEMSVSTIIPSSHTAYTGQVVRLAVHLAANRAGTTEVQILHRGVVVQSRPVVVKAEADNVAFFDVPVLQPGASTWRATIVGGEDHFVVNNQASCTIDVKGRPRLLVLHERRQEMRGLSRALAKQDFEVEVRGTYGLEISLQELLAFDGVVLANVPASDLSMSQMNMLKSYVSDFGGGLLMMGSENSFGLGGYYKTPVEEVLPLVSRFEKEKETPSMAMVLVIDKSGSMQGLPISLAKQAAKAAVELMSPQDQAAVVAFDSQARVICEMTSASDPDTINANIDTLAAGGGTFMYPGMQLACEMLDRTAAKIRHVIILSDGQSQPGDHEGLAAEMSDYNITVSTVAMGSGADRGLLAAIAEIGRGRYYETNDPSNVPQIFTRETMQASKSAIKEDLYTPLIIADHPMLSGYGDNDLPFTLGYVMTRAKPTAQVLMAVETGDPLLAMSRYGLGVGMAYTSDLTEKWGGEWLAWDECGRFWAQVLRNICRKADTEGLYVRERIEDGDWVVDMKRTDPAGRPVHGIGWQVTLTDPDNRTRPVEAEQVGIGLYRARASLGEVQRASLSIHDRDYNKTAVVHYNRPYPAEYDLAGKVDESLLDLPGCSGEEVVRNIERVRIYRPVGNMLIMLAMVLFIGGILLRRL